MKARSATAAAFGLLLAACAATPPTPAVRSARPQLDHAQAARYTRQEVLAAAGRAGALVRDGWDPLADRVITGAAVPPLQYRVDPKAADGRRVFATVQAAVNRAHHEITAGTQPAARIYIGIAPGRYEETVYLPASRTPVTLWGLGRTPGDVVIHETIDGGMPRADYRARLGPVYEAADMHPDIAAIYRHCAKETTTPTSCTAVVWVAGDGFQARNLSVVNGYDASRLGQAHQAVAFKSEGADRVHLEQVHLLGHQDTLYLRAPAPDATVRTFVHRSLVAGDVDFIFGPATAYFLRSEIRWVGARRGLAGGWVAAPSTHLRIPYGFVFDDCDFTGDAAAVPGTVHLARQWFTGATCSPYGAAGARCTIAADDARQDGTTLRRLTLAQVGKMVVLNSRLGAHLNAAAPWAPWQTDRTHRAYRPVQRDSEDFQALLVAAGHDPARLGWPRIEPPEPFLAEYRNTAATAP